MRLSHSVSKGPKPGQIYFRHPHVKDAKGQGLLIMRSLARFSHDKQVQKRIITDLQKLLDLHPTNPRQNYGGVADAAKTLYFYDAKGKSYPFTAILPAEETDDKAANLERQLKLKDREISTAKARIAELEAHVADLIKTVTNLSGTAELHVRTEQGQEFVAEFTKIPAQESDSSEKPRFEVERGVPFTSKSKPHDQESGVRSLEQSSKKK